VIASETLSVDAAIRVALPGTCGELVQGTLDGVPCLISCPIERYSVAEVYCRAGVGWTLSPAAPKTRAAIRTGLAYLGRTDSSGSVQLHSALPRGRGYGSSTADIGAALYALGHATGRPLEPAEVARLAIQVEPSDSSLFPGLTLWDHVHGTLYEPLGPPPALTVVVLDPGGEVDTVAFNRLDHRSALRRLAPQHREAFTLMLQGLKYGDLEALGAAVTLSAISHQAILSNPFLEPVLALAHEVGALGLCRAHSGTLLGLLLDPSRTDTAGVVARAVCRLGRKLSVFSLSLVRGGPRVLSETVAAPFTL
jgi:L-threonine kinase